MQIPGDVKNFPDQGTSKLLSVREGTKERPWGGKEVGKEEGVMEEVQSGMDPMEPWWEL
jgi:hypothetical protein